MANEYIRKEWAGGVVRTTLNGAINSTATAITVTDGSSFPSGVKPFVLVIDRGTATEEKIICSSRTGNNLTVLQRGYDGSSGQSHSSGAYIEHALDAYTVDQANAIAATMTTQGDIVYKTVTGDNTSFGRLGIGTTGYPLVSGGTAPAYQQLGQAGIASTAVTAAKINADVAGTGLSKNGTTGALDVNVDGTSIAITSDTLNVPNNGITLAKLAALTAGNMIIGNASNVATATPMTGDVTMGPAGVTSIANNVIVLGDFAASVKPVAICTSTTRPTGIVEGQIIYETDTDRILSYSGTAWIVEAASGSYTPTVDNLTLGTGGTNSAVWAYSRGVLNVSGLITLGTGGSVTGNLLVSYPSGFQADPVYETDSPIGSVMFAEGSTQHVGTMSYNSGSRMKPLVHSYNPTLGVTSYVGIAGTSGTVPFTWSATDDCRWTAAINGTMTP